MADPASKARPVQVSWLIPPGLSIEEVVGALARSRRCSEEAPQVVRQTWLDSFDWRLHRRGWTFLHETGADARVSSGRARAAGGALGSSNFGSSMTENVTELPKVAKVELQVQDSALPMLVHLDQPVPPGDSGALPDSRLRSTIAPVLGVRCLLPCAVAVTRRRTIRVLDADEKTVAWVLAETSVDPEGAPLGKRARVLSLRGYADAEEVDKFLTIEMGLTADAGVRAAALASARRSAGDYSSKLNVALSPSTGIDAAVKSLLAHLLGTVEANRAGTCANLDPEFLHDVRVATRRARSLLGEAAPYLACSPDTASLRSEIGWLGEVTGPTRDLDVWLITLDDELRGAPPVPHELRTLRSVIEERRRVAHAQLVDELGSARYQALRAGWAALASPSPAGGGDAAGAAGGGAAAASPGAGGGAAVAAGGAAVAVRGTATRATGQVAAELVRRAHRRVLRRGAAIGPDSPDESLHDLRKATKRLRYVLESFESLCPGGVFDRVLTELKALQDNLGEFQDCSVQAAALSQLGADLKDRIGSRSSAPPEALIAIGYLVAGLESRRTKARASFADRFARFERPAARRLVDSLVRSLTEGKGAAKK